jgi:rubrerythrin
MSTKDNLQDAFAGESQANRKYLAFAKKADAEGRPQIAKLFRAAAEAETVHAHSHLRVLGGVKGTAENLQTAIEGEGFEFKEMYPKFIAEAEQEGNKQAITSFQYANAVEEVHHKLYSEALEKFNAGADLPEADIHVCGVCGYTIAGEPPDNCPVCGSVRKVFHIVA